MELTNEKLTKLIAGLRRMTEVDYKPLTSCHGICANLEWDTAVYDWRETDAYANAVKSWPKFSGEIAFPVEGHSVYWTIPNKWTGKHLIARRSLAAHIANEFEKLLQQPS